MIDWGSAEEDSEELKTKKPVAKKKSSKSPNFAQAFGGDIETRREVARATGAGGSSTHGRYIQDTFRLPPELYEAYREYAEQLGITYAEMKRWMVARAVSALKAGERPPTKTVSKTAVDFDQV